MHLFLTDRTLCPRCGPDFGLILLAHEVEERRVLSGDLGCPNCRERYPIREGFADLRIPPRSPLLPPGQETDSVPPDAEETVRMGALLGVAQGPGTLLIKGHAVRFAQGLFDIIGGVEIVGLDPSLIGTPEAEGVSRMTAGPRIPFSSHTFLGVLLSGGVTRGDLEEGARIVAPGGRIVVLDAPRDAHQCLEALGLTVLLRDAGVLVCQQEASGSRPLVTLRGL